MHEGSPHDLARITGTLVTMAKAARVAMRQASTALLTADHVGAHEVTVRDAEIDVLHRVVTDRALDLLSRQPTGADDVHAVLTALRIAADLDRMGRLAAHVARATLRRHPTTAAAPELAHLFRAMAASADDLAGKVVTVLTEHDLVLAAQLDSTDDEMDRLHRQLFSVVLSPHWPLSAEAAIDGALLGRYYERYADHAVTIGHHLTSEAAGRPGRVAVA